MNSYRTIIGPTTLDRATRSLAILECSNRYGHRAHDLGVLPDPICPSDRRQYIRSPGSRHALEHWNHRSKSWERDTVQYIVVDFGWYSEPDGKPDATGPGNDGGDR